MTRRLIMVVLLIAACGEDKNYGDPIDNPQATQSALGAIANAQLLPSMMTNDTALFAINGLSGNFNLMTGAKFNAGQQGQAQQAASSLLRVDEACLEIDGDTMTYLECDFAGTTVSGTVTTSTPNVTLSLSFVSLDEDFSQTTDVSANIEVSDSVIDGFVDFDLEIISDGVTIGATFDGDFSVDLAEGCAVSGDLEVHAVARTNGRKQSIWAKADYDGCESVTVR